MNYFAIALTGFLGGVVLSAQTPSFEAASIKPSSIGAGEKMSGDVRSYKTDPGRLTYTNVTLRDCIKQAWNLKDYQVEGPQSMSAARFNVVATAAGATPEDQMRIMLQALLIERFKLVIRMETRELPAYALTAGNKVKVQPSAEDTVFAKGLDGGYLYYRHISMEQFAEVLSGFKGRPVLDNTGLKGFYDVRLDIFEDPADMKKSMIRGDFGDVAAAAVESQLGLRTEPRKSPIPMLIVDQAEKNPIEN
jgi:uncharacterized protein (TIGR03435 family)